MSTHDCYAGECYEKQASETYCASEFEPKDNRERIMVESAYRRGYSQGFFNCIGLPESAARVFWHVVLDWRMKKHGGALELPPDFFMWLRNLRKK